MSILNARSLSLVFDGPVREREDAVKTLVAIGSPLVAVAAALDVPARVGLPAIRPQVTAESIPRTLDECFAVLAKKLPAETLAEMQRGSEDDMIRYHHGLGTWLRNNWGLWDRGPLYQHFHALGLNNPDDMSGVILDSFWRYLHERPLEVEKQVAAYREYERLAKYPSPKSNPRCPSAIEVVMSLHWDWPDGSPRIIHMGECCADHVVWSYGSTEAGIVPTQPRVQHGATIPMRDAIRAESARPSNKEMKLTSVEPIGRSQLISSVRQT